MKHHAFLAASLACLLVLPLVAVRAQAPPIAVDLDALDIFDNGPIEGNEIEIVNGMIVVKNAGDRKPEKPDQPDPAGEQVLELTDGSQLHGTLVSLGRNELVWQRADTKEPLVFSPQEVRRIALGGAQPPAGGKGNATLKLQGGDWLAGNLSAVEKGRFQLELGGAASVEVERGKVEWFYLSPSGSPDTYEGPIGPMGLAGWDTGGPGGGAWDYSDGALVARAAAPITRRLDFLTDKVDVEFTASDGGSSVRGLTLWLQPGGQTRGYTKGSVYLRFQASTISANSYDGQNMKNFSANVPEEKGAPRQTRYRILQNRRAGKLIIFVNGRKIADWDLPPIKEVAPGGSMSWQPSYWSSNMSWTLSKVRLRPWDGTLDSDAKPDEAGKDVLSTGAPGRQAGAFEGVSKDSVQFGGKEFTRKEPIFVRLAGGDSTEPLPGAVARVWLSQRGEFDVSGLGIRDGQLKVRTSFSGDVTLPLAAVHAIEFPHRLSATEKTVADGGDTLVFRNGDELRGSLISAGEAVKWKPVKAEKAVEFRVGRLAGVLLAKPARPPQSAGSTAVRFRNGDWLSGELRLLDKRHVLLKSPLAENLQVDRAAVGTLYFGASGEAPVWDGAADRQVWMTGIGRKDEQVKRNPWRYLDGAFTLMRSNSRGGYGNGPNLGRNFDDLPDKVEVSFELSTPKGPAGYAVQLFTEENKPGLMIQGGWDSAYIYDMSPRKQGGVFFNQPLQVEFGETVGSEGDRRQFRFLADRKTGRLAMFVNGIMVTQFGQRAGKETAKPGRGISVVPQPMNSTVTLSNLWVAPWGGALPEMPKKAAKNAEKEPAEPEVPSPPEAGKPKVRTTPADEAKPKEPSVAQSDVVALVNGDETSGIVESASPGELRLKCDVGDLEIPLKRALVVEFAGAPAPPAAGIRLRLAGKGALTVQSFKLENGKVFCHSAAAGDLSFPIGALSEIIFQPRSEPPPVSKTTGENRSNPGINGIQGGVIIRGNGIRLNGGAIQFNGGAIIVK